MPLQLPLPFALPASPRAVSKPEGSPDTVSEARVPRRDVALEKATRLARFLSSVLHQPVKLFVTDNRSTMLSFRKNTSNLQVRVHHLFLDAPPDITRAIADYAGKGSRRAGRAIDRYVKQRQASIRAALPHEKSRPISAAGRHHDLHRYFEDLNRHYFDDQVNARIGWGAFSRRKRRRSIRMGVYDHDTRTIRVHPALDSLEVPPFFVAYIVFHEMLHQVIPARARGGRHEHHSAEFRKRERAYPEYDRAIAWEKTHLGLLLAPMPGEPSRRPWRTTQVTRVASGSTAFVPDL
jgi:hypothetical protein